MIKDGVASVVGLKAHLKSLFFNDFNVFSVGITDFSPTGMHSTGSL